MAQLTVGLDLGNETVKRVRLRSSFRTVEVVDFTCLPVPEDDRPRAERIGEVLRSLEGGSNPTDIIATALPGDEVSLRLLTLPFGDAKRVAQTIGFELEGQIPFPLDQVVFDYLKAGDTDGGGSRQLVAMCQLARMRSWLQMFEEAGYDPRLVGSDNLAYTSLLPMLPESAEDATVALLDVGHQLTSLCIVGPDGVEFARTLSGGGAGMTAQLAEAFKVERARAEEGKRRGGFVESALQTARSPEQVVISDAVKRATSALIRELRQSVTAHRTVMRRPLSKIWLCGGGATVSNFDGYLADELGVEVERIRRDHFDLPGVEQLDGGDSDATTWAKALGLALHAHQGGRRDWLNLRRGPFAFKGDFEVLRGKILHVGVAVLILIFLAIGYAITSYLSLSSADRKLDGRMQEVSRAIVGSQQKDPDVIKSIMKEKMSFAADLLPRVTALDVLRELHERVSEDTRLRFKDVDISPKKVRITGFTDSFESVEKIKAELEKYNCFKDIQTGKTQKTLDGQEVEFRFTIVFGC